MPHTHTHTLVQFMKRLSRVNLCKYRLRAKVIVPFFCVCKFCSPLYCKPNGFSFEFRLEMKRVFLFPMWNELCLPIHNSTHTNRIPSILSYPFPMAMKMNTLLFNRASHRLENPAGFLFRQINSHFHLNKHKYNKFTQYFDFTET